MIEIVIPLSQIPKKWLLISTLIILGFIMCGVSKLVGLGNSDCPVYSAGIFCIVCAIIAMFYFTFEYAISVVPPVDTYNITFPISFKVT
jgi:hypothetical protein